MEKNLVERVENIVLRTLLNFKDEIQEDAIKDLNRDTIIYGRRGIFDSVQLVAFIVDLEQKIFEEFGKDIILANEKTMSYRVSPFRTVESLTNYIIELLTKDENE